MVRMTREFEPRLQPRLFLKCFLHVCQYTCISINIVLCSVSEWEVPRIVHTREILGVGFWLPFVVQQYAYTKVTRQRPGNESTH